MNQEILRMEQITVASPGGMLLDHTWINCFRGEIIALLGLNDSGKTCMMRVLIGDCPDYSGKVWIDEQPVRISSGSDARRRGIFLIRRSFSLIPEMSVAENIFLVHPKGYPFFISSKKQNCQAREILSRFGIDLSQKKPAGDLTYYQKFMVELCRAAIKNPRIVIIDGILSRFSGSEIAHVESIFRQLTGSGVSLILVDHHLMPATTLCNRLFVLRGGRNAGCFTRKHISKSAIFSQMIGSPARPFDTLEVPEHPAAPSARQLDFHHISVDSVWKDISFQVGSGEILGLINIDDPDGFIWRKLFLGGAVLSAGCILVNGKPLDLFPERSPYNTGIALMMEPFYLFPALSLSENIVLPAMRRNSKALGVLNMPELKYLVDELSSGYISDEDFQNSFLKVVKPNRLLERQVSLCKILSADPDYLVVVNPTHGLDTPSKQRIYDDLLSIKRRGRGILLQSTSIDDLTSVCDRLIIIQNERLAECPSGSDRQNFIEEYGRYLSEI